jgi:tripartite-type tricarboxylate transporter receptor subunit TctC
MTHCDHYKKEENMSSRKIRVGICALISFLLITWGVGVVHSAEKFPIKPIRIVCSQGAGSANDLVDRMLQDPLSKILGVPVVIENKPGGGGALSGDYVAQSKPDGYTLLSSNSASMTIIPILTPKQFPGRNELDLVCKIGGSPYVLAVKADSPFKTLEDMLNFAKKNPGKLTYGSAGHGSASYFTMEILKYKAGADVTFVPMTAGSTNSVALLGGHVDMILDTLGPQRGLIESGTIRTLAMTKNRFIPKASTFEEKGFPEIRGGLIPILVRKGTPKPIVEKLMQAFDKVIKTPSVIRTADNLGFVLDFQRAEDVSKEILLNSKVIEEIVKKLGMVK